MGRMKDLMISTASHDEIDSMVKNAMNLEIAGYVDFLEKELARKDKALEEIRKINQKIIKLLNNNK
jgi:hypothetical protein